MVFKGPKELVAEEIAYELSDYIEVDPKDIKSHLLSHSKVIMQNVKLKEQTVEFPQSVASITGTVDLITFKWSWTVPNKNSEEHGWVKDAILTMLGFRVKVRFDRNKTGGTGQTKEKETPLLREEQTKVEDDIEKDIQETTEQGDEDKLTEQEGRIDLYIDRQEQNVLDYLTVDFKTVELTIEMPLESEHESDDQRTMSFVFSGQSVDLSKPSLPAVSPGETPGDDSQTTGEQKTDNQKTDDEKTDDQKTDEQKTNDTLEQRLTVSSLSANVVVTAGQAEAGSQKQVSYPLMEPFSYSATVARVSGLRFESPMTGLNIVGCPIESAVDTVLAEAKDKGVVLHAGAVQLKALTQLTDMVAAPSSETSDNKGDTKPTGVINKSEPVKKDDPGVVNAASLTESKDSENGETEATIDSTPSTFEIPISSLSIVLLEDKTLIMSGVNVKYQADGSLMNMEAERIDLKSTLESGEEGLNVGVSGIRCSVLPEMALHIDAIETVHIPDVVDLTKELRSPSIEFIGDTVYVDVKSTVEATMLAKSDSQEKATSTSSTQPDAAASRTSHEEDDSSQQAADSEGAVAPFPMRIALKEIKVTKEADQSLTELSDFVLAFKPQYADFVGTAVAVRLGEFKNDLLHCKNASASVVVPQDLPSVMHGFTFDADSIHVKSGYTIEDWAQQFEPSIRRLQFRQQKKGPTKMPYAEVAKLKIGIAYKGTGVSVKETTVNVRAFHGTADTDTKDIVNYYARACLRRVPGFVSNAQILGHNVVEETAVTYGAYAGIETLGGPGAVAMLAGLDTAKSILARGKESRHASSDDKYRFGDFTRGALKTPGFLEKKGARFRGKDKDDQGGKIADMAVGAACGTGQYAVNNKARLGAAFAAGLGVVGGTMLGGPVAGIVAGIVAGAVADKAIKKFDKSSIGKEANRKITEDLAGASASDHEHHHSAAHKRFHLINK